MNVMRLWFVAAAASLVVVILGSEVPVAARQTPGPSSPPVFTAEQATAGKLAYGRTCAKCHMPDLGGTADAPPLSGARFLATWRMRTTKELFDFVLGGMPPGGPAVNGEVKPEVYAAILAYVLQSNGAVPGATPFESTVVFPLDKVVRVSSAK